MPCPVCESTDFTEIVVQLKRESDLSQLLRSSHNGRFMARCDECTVLYDHQYQESRDDDPSPKRSCPACGARNAVDRDRCSYCDEPLE